MAAARPGRRVEIQVPDFLFCFEKVGCGGGKGKSDATKSGSFLVLKAENLALRHEAKV